MYAVGRIGSYITRGVYTVAGPFHPFGGAVDIIVVEQPDGTFKSSPWYVRFGKFQGVLKAREKVVNISVNGVEADFHMYLNQRGEAFFLRDEEGESGESVLYGSSSSDDADEHFPRSRRPMKSKSYDYDGANSNSSVRIDSSNGKIIARTNSRRSRILGLMFGQRSLKKDIDQGDIGAEVIRTDSLERAEIAANLLELKWSTNLATSKKRKDSTSLLFVSGTQDTTADRGMQNDDGQNLTGAPTGLCKKEVGNISCVNSENLECPIKEAGMEMVSLASMKEVSETALLGECVIEEKCEVVSEILKKNNEVNLHIDGDNDNVEHIISEVNKLESHNTDVFKECPTKKFDEEQASDKEEDRHSSEFNTPKLLVHDVPEAFIGKQFDEIGDVNVAIEGFGISEVECGYDRVPSFIRVETSESLVVGLDGSSEQTYETLYVANREAGELQFAADLLHVTSDLQHETTAIRADGNLEMETERTEATNNGSQNEEMNLKVPLAVSESYTHAVGVAPTSGLFKDIESHNCTISNSSNLDCPIQFKNTCQSKAASISVSESSEEDQFLFSDLDESKLNESVDCLDKGKDPLKMREESEDSIKAFNTNAESDSFPFQKNGLSDLGISSDDCKVTLGPIDIPRAPSVSDEQIERLVESLPVIRSLVDNLDSDNVHPLSHSLGSTSDTLEWTLHGKNKSYPLNVETGDGIQSAEKLSNLEDIYNLDDKNEAAIGDANTNIVAPGQSWGIWPFSFRRSRSRKIVQPVLIDTRISNVENVSESCTDANAEKILLKPKVIRKVKAMTPTSEQLASLNLQEGRNVITFTFSTAVWGKQKVDASIYLWKWNTRIVISDVDGTITRSDVLGQFMPLVGVDWSQTGVANLFSGIKENGYQLLFLSARAISQAYLTRQFLVNLKQDGKALPDGPVVISPDGLFPSLFREVIRRAPHEFKIACLEDIKALFPPDCNPFYAGFGNRDTDELSYLKVGIPRGKIFTINPKGEVAVNRQVDTKSYTSLHTLVHDMFPPRTSSEQEDYNSWNYWRLPPPVVDI